MPSSSCGIPHKKTECGWKSFVNCNFEGPAALCCCAPRNISRGTALHFAHSVSFAGGLELLCPECQHGNVRPLGGQPHYRTRDRGRAQVQKHFLVLPLRSATLGPRHRPGSDSGMDAGRGGSRPPRPTASEGLPEEVPVTEWYKGNLGLPVWRQVSPEICRLLTGIRNSRGPMSSLSHSFRRRAVGPHMRGSQATDSGSSITLRRNSGWAGLISQLYSLGARTEGTRSKQSSPRCTNSSPTWPRSGGAAGARQFLGRSVTSIRCRLKSSGNSATAKTRLEGGSSLSR